MNKLENYTIDVLRVLETWRNKNFLSVDAVLKNWFKYNTDMEKYSRQIQDKILKNNWTFTIEEDDGLKINESGLAYLESVQTDEYIIDRCFEELQTKEYFEYLDSLLSPLHIKVDDAQRKYLESVLCKSELIDYKDEGYYKTFKLNSKGIIALRNAESYSQYKKKFAGTKKDEFDRTKQFSYNEEQLLNSKIDQILKDLEDLKTGQEILWTDLTEELNELKELYNLGKKNWRQIFMGKLLDMVAAGVISETVSKEIAKAIAPAFKSFWGLE